jgi:alkylated DNA nucleotide flippase Atl1
MSGVWQHDGTEWALTAPVGFEDEEALRTLVEEAPEMLPLSGSPRVIVVGREVQLGSGFADLLAVEPGGRPVVIEVKLARNAEARRAVVAQALAYAAYLFELDSDDFEHDVLGGQLRDRGWSSLTQAVAASDQEGSFIETDFHAALADAFTRGAFRVVFVLDEAPPELVRLIAYLEAVSDALTIDLITVEAYEFGGSRVLIPQRVDPERRRTTERARPLRSVPGGATTPGADDFVKAIDDASGEHQPALRALAEWAQGLEGDRLAKLWTYNGRGRKTLLPYIPGEEAGLVTLWNDGEAYIQFWRSVFVRRAPSAIEHVEALIAPVTIGQGNTTREVTDELLAALRGAYEEARSTAKRGFDWSKVRAAVEAIPAGHWTTYGDLAELAGTSAIAVGRYVANEADLEGAWRVLGSDGKARPDFRWGDPADTRDLQEVLASEGLAVSSGGIADPSKRLRRGELEKLVKT